MSLIPFVSGWMGENHFEGLTVTMYGVVLLMTAVGYYVLTLSLLKSHSSESIIHQAVGNKMKERISLITYVIALILSFRMPKIAFTLYSFVALVWLYPDSRIEKLLSK